MEQPPLSTDDESTLMFAAIGRAINSWSHIESNLHSIFAAFIETSFTVPEGGVVTGGGVSAALFHSVENFRMRLEMIDTVMNAELSTERPEDEPILTLWGAEKVKVSSISKCRNKLAHWNVIIFPQEKPMRRARLVPHYRSPENAPYALGKKPGLTIADIGVWANSFWEAANRLSPLVKALGSHERLQERCVRQAENLLDNIGRSDPDRAERLRQQFSPPQ